MESKSVEIHKGLSAKPKIVEVCKGLSVKRGFDGHWIGFKSGGKYANINVENVFGNIGGTIIYSTIMN